MAPLYPRGTLVAVEPIDAAQVRPGMVIVFADPAQPSRLVAHRVVAELPGAVPVFRTKGDRNLADDPYPVFPTAVRGRVRWGIPGAGTAVTAVNTWWGGLLLIGIPAGTLAGTEVLDYRRRRHLETNDASALDTDSAASLA